MMTLSEHYNEDKTKKAVVGVNMKTHCYHVEYWSDGKYSGMEFYPGKSVHWAIDCAENWVLGIKHTIMPLCKTFNKDVGEKNA